MKPKSASALFLALVLRYGRHAPRPPPPARCGWTTSTPATPPRSVFSLDRVVSSRCAWPGNPQRPLDDTNLGKYFFEVIDRGTNRVLYSRGFASVYGEWETTGEAKDARRTFSESLRFPAPAGPVQIVLKKRDAKNAFREVWSLLVDPKDMFIDTAAPPSPGPLLEIEKHGRPGRQGRLPDPRRRLHGGRARQVREGRAAADGDALRGLALQGAPRRLQRLGALSRRGGVRHLAALDRHPPALPRSARPTTPSAPSATS